jgi:hypothetical protein
VTNDCASSYKQPGRAAGIPKMLGLRGDEARSHIEEWI